MNFKIDYDGHQLEAAVHLPGQPDLKAVCIMCHGFRGSKDGGGRAVLLADEIAGLGFAVVRFNFTPLQKLSRQVAEIGAVVQYCQDRISRRIILLGRSMGGSAAVVYASKEKNVTGLCLWATPWNLTATFQAALGSGYEVLEQGQTLARSDAFGNLRLEREFIDDFKQFDLLEHLRNLDKIPVLVLHGSQDNIVELSQAETVYQLLPEPKEFKIIAGGDHQFANHSQEAVLVVKDWLKRNFI
ncbi:alpha/beta hydrolase|uniref:Putative redox protein n=1 Tax=Dendrosporobacter quercicolus TaxID=146817 RepID=A0A1G9KEC4_9FIRM|nr:alpha/beta hydrolase [Dendrosporobacter quercicolus]NSL49758.1 alpha/beta hydrolase [Dendrosporobacter quercicolus DSM 1736]SDL48158.1 putative redox protein [Dendrosporobacter quercicolus]